MLRLLCLFVFISFCISNISAQISESSISMSKGTENAFSFKMENFNYKVIQSDWKNYIKSLEGKAKKDKKTKEVSVEKILLSSISETPINLYSTFNKSGKKDCEVSIWFDLDGTYLSSGIHPDKKEAVDRFINDFILFAYTAQLERKQATAESNDIKIGKAKVQIINGKRVYTPIK